MVERRQLVGGGIVASLTALMGESSASAAAAVSEDSLQISGSIDQLRKTLEGQFDQTYTSLWRGVARVRPTPTAGSRAFRAARIRRRPR